MCDNICFVFFLIAAILTDVRWSWLWFSFAFLWWLMMLSIFSCAYWPSVYLSTDIWENVYSGLLPFLIQLFVWCWLVWAVYIFLDINTLFCPLIFKHFFPFSRFVFFIYALYYVEICSLNPSFWKIFIINGCFSLTKAFSASVEMII